MTDIFMMLLFGCWLETMIIFYIKVQESILKLNYIRIT